MTEEKFTELVNLYLDKEISAEDRELLQSELAADPQREAAFNERVRLHRATRMALSPESRRRRSPQGQRKSSGQRSRRSRGSKSSRSETRIRRVDEQVAVPAVSHFPRWMLGSGLAASLLLAALLLPGVFRDTVDVASQPELVGVSQAELDAVEDPLDQVARSELLRFASSLENESHEHASLVAQMRLLGLRPELTPREKELRRVELSELRPKQRGLSQAELLAEIQKLKAIPEPQLLEIEVDRPQTTSPWSTGFKTSLVNY